MAELQRGITCKACGKSISSDPELCPYCLDIARSCFRDIDPPDEDTIPYDEVMHHALIQVQEE